MGHIKETPEDRATKERLWEATRRELLRFAQRYAEEHKTGERVTEGQKDVAAAAKSAGYHKTVLYRLGSLVRRGLTDSEDGRMVLSDYRDRIGL